MARDIECWLYSVAEFVVTSYTTMNNYSTICDDEGPGRQQDMSRPPHFPDRSPQPHPGPRSQAAPRAPGLLQPQALPP